MLDMGRSERYICMLAGIALSGGIAVYIHRGWPAKQRELVLKDCEPFLIVDHKVCDELMSALTGEMPCALPDVYGEDPFQIVYTSGSTGAPKGAVLCHLTAANMSRLSEKNRLCRMDVERCERRLIDADFSFVLTSIMISRALFNGGTLVIADEEELSSVGKLAGLLQKERVDMVTWTPSRILHFLENPDMVRSMRRIRVMAMAGEKLPPHLGAVLAEKLPDTLLFSAYGMSELMHVGDHLYDSQKGNLIVSGAENIGLHVLTPQGEETAKGDVGELCVSGIPARLGFYWNNSKLTEEKYTIHPQLGRIFHTGDLAAVEKNGAIDDLSFAEDGYIAHRERAIASADNIAPQIRDYYANVKPLYLSPEPLKRNQNGIRMDEVELDRREKDYFIRECAKSGILPYSMALYAFGQAILRMENTSEVWMRILDAGRYMEWGDEFRIIGNLICGFPVRVSADMTPRQFQNDLLRLRDCHGIMDSDLLSDRKWAEITEGLVFNNFVDLNESVEELQILGDDKRRGNTLSITDEGLFVRLRHADMDVVNAWYQELARVFRNMLLDIQAEDVTRDE